MTEKQPNGDPTIVIVGAGPRGLSVLERLVTIGSAIDAPGSNLVVEIVDPYEFGAGRIWRSDQSGALLMNTVIGQITIFGHDPAEPEEDAGPSFWEWLQESSDPEHTELATQRLRAAAGVRPIPRRRLQAGARQGARVGADPTDPRRGRADRRSGRAATR